MMIADYFNSIFFRIRETKNQFNEVNFTDSLEIPCRVEVSTKLVTSKAGKEVLSSFLFFAPEDCDLVETDKIMYLNKTYEIITINHEQGFIQSHKEIYI